MGDFFTVVLPYINFLIFLALIYRFAKKPASEFALKNRQEFLSNYEKAQHEHTEALNEERSLKAKVNAFSKEVEELAKQSHEDSQRQYSKIIEEAKQFVSYLKSQQEQASTIAKKQAILELREEILKEVTIQVSKQLQTSLSMENHKAIVERDILDLKKSQGVR